MTEQNVVERLELILRGTARPTTTALPVEQLAHDLVALRTNPERLDAVVALLGDGWNGGLLYRSQRELVLDALERALAPLDAAARFKLLTASLEIRPIDGEQLVRFVRFALDALGLVAGKAADVCAGWTREQHRVVYRWSYALLGATALHTTEIAALFAERGITGTGGHPWDVFQAFVGYRATVLFTPRMSPAVAHELTTMQRTDLLDMPWMFGAAKSTFTLDEIEEDSAPQNMDDGRRISHSIIRQRAPSTDFFAKTFAWHPRQTLDHVRAVARERGFDLIEPAPADRAPRVLERHELSAAGRALQGRAVRAMARVDAASFPVDVTLAFHAAEHNEERGVLEFSVATSFKNDGKKVLVRATLGDPEALLDALQRHASLLTPGTLPLAIAKLFGSAATLELIMPEGPHVVVTPALVALWDPSASRTAGALAARTPIDQTRSVDALVGTWRGHSSIEHYPDPQPYVMQVEPDPQGLRVLATTPDFGPLELKGTVIDGRIALRQVDSGHYILEGAWDAAARKLEGRWRYADMGGTVSLALQAPPREASAEELLNEVIRPWEKLVRLELDALRFPGEHELLRALFDDEHFRATYLESAAARAMGTEAKQLDNMIGRGATQLTRAMLPSVFRALDVVRTTLGMTEDVRLWVHNDSSLNAFVTVDDGTIARPASTIAVHFTSGLLETLTEVELQATIGHELGHVLFGVHDLALRLRGTQMSGESQLRYLALRRLQELSADRLSLVACADPHAVFLTQTMLRTGIKRRDLFGGVDSLFENARAEVDKLRSRPHEHIAYDSHPYTSLRTVALELFAQSSTFKALRPDAKLAIAGPRLDDAKIGEQLASLSQLIGLPPKRTAASVAGAAIDAVPRFLALAALRLVEADQSIGVRELAALGRVHEQMSTQLREVLAWTHERRDVEIIALRKDVNEALSMPEREELLERLLKVVRADNVVQFAEANIVGDLGRLLEVDTPSFRKTIDELYRGAR